MEPAVPAPAMGKRFPHRHAEGQGYHGRRLPNSKRSSMSRIRLALVAAVAVSALLVAEAQAAAPKLVGTVGPGFTITLTKGGKKVTKLMHGSYTIVINDKSPIHNFHLKGPGLNKSTGVTQSGTTTWKVKFRKGTYKFVCDPHASAMKGSFKVS
jgi:plastocyanin